MGLKENIKRQREISGLTLEDVARRVGVSRQTIQKYESGIVTNIPSDKIEAMASLFGVSPGYLMGWTDDSNSNERKQSHTITSDDNLINFLSESKEKAQPYRRIVAAQHGGLAEKEKLVKLQKELALKIMQVPLDEPKIKLISNFIDMLFK